MSHDARPNPYVGPRSFRTGEIMYGRDQELSELLNLVIAERIVLLHSPSGAGKSSLVQAGLIPRLQQDGFLTLPVARVNHEPPEDLRSKPGFNRYIFSVLISFEEAVPEDNRVRVDDLAGMDFATYLKHFHAQLESLKLEGDPPIPTAEVWILDQFEEILTTEPTDRDGKIAFFTQFGSALRDRSRWALFSMRDDYVASLEPYLRPIPTRLSNKFRLDLLGVPAALQAITQPALTAGVKFVDAAALQLADDLRRVQVQRPDGNMESQLGPYVEPVQLQVVCYRLWQNLKDDDVEITLDAVGRIGDVNQSLRDYYGERVAAAAEESGVSERAVREWFEHKLITESGVRGQVLMGVDRSDGLDNRAIRIVVDAHLVRGEKRRGATWFELAHDRLLEPVKTSNDFWFQKNLNLLQQQASLWRKQERPDHLLLRSQSLDESVAWVQAHPDDLSLVDREFLDACLEVRKREEEKLEAARQVAESERRRAEEQALAAKKLRGRFIVAVVAALAALVFAGLAFVSGNQAREASQKNLVLASTNIGLAEVAQSQSIIAIGNAKTAQANAEIADFQRATAVAAGAIAQAARADALQQKAAAESNAQLAQEQANLARSRELAGLALGYLENESDLALLLSIEAFRKADTGGALDAFMRAVQRNLSREVQRLDQRIPQQPISIYAMAASPDGKRLAWGGAGGLIRVWDFEVKNFWEGFTDGGKDVNTLAFSPDGKILASGDTSATIIFWDSIKGQKLRVIHPELVSIFTLSFSPDGSKLAYAGKAAGNNVNLFIKNLDNNRFMGLSIRPTKSVINTLAWSPDNKLLVTGGEDRTVRFWDIDTGRELQKFTAFDGKITSVAFSPNGEWLATGAQDKTLPIDKNILLWDVTLCQRPRQGQDIDPWEAVLCKQQTPFSFIGQAADINSLAFSPDGQILAAGDSSGTTRLWEVHYRELLDQQPQTSSQAVSAVTFSQSSEMLLLAISSTDRSINLSNLRATDTLFDLTARIDASAASLAVLEDGTLHLIGNDGKLSIWQGDTPGEIGSSVALDISADAVAISKDARRLAAVQSDGQTGWIELIDLDQNTSVVHIASPNALLMAVQEQPDGSSITDTLQTTVDVVTSVAISSNGELLAGGVCVLRDTVLDLCANSDIYLWNTATGEVIDQFNSGHAGAILSLAFSPDDKILASGGSDAAIYLRDLERGRLLGLPLIGQGGAVTSLAFNHDADLLASGGSNGLLILWNVSSAQQIANPLIGFQGTINSLSFYPDDQTLVVGGETGTLAWWRLSTWFDLACKYSQRNISAAEWEQFFKDETYRQTCSQWPSGQ